ncbi:MAG: transposase [Bacteroidota bacterium]
MGENSLPLDEDFNSCDIPVKQSDRKGSHTLFDLKYHLVWITKYRKKVLVRTFAVRSRELIGEICKENEIEILKGHVSYRHTTLAAFRRN